MTRTTAKYVALLALSIILFHWKTLLTNQFTTIAGAEGVNQTYAWLHFWLSSIWSGHIPRWDPYTFGGRPFAGETQTTAYYPFRLLFALIPLNRNGLVSPRFYEEYVAFIRFLGALFMFALLRELRASRFAAFVGACAFSMGGLLGRLPWPQLMESCIWLPAVFLFLLRALRAESYRRALIYAGVGGLCIGLSILTGGIPFSMMQSIFAVTAVGFYGAVTRPKTLAAFGEEDRARWLRLVSIVAVILLAAAGTGAVQLLPSFEYARYSLRFIAGGAFPMAEKIPYDRMDHGMWPNSILTGIFAASGVNGGGETWPFYIGVFPFFMAVTAIWKCRANIWVRYLTALATLAFIYALGELTPLNGILYALVPDLWMIREPSRFFYLVAFALAVLAAFGLDSLLDGAGQPAVWSASRPFLKWIAIAGSAALVLPGIFNQLAPGIWVCFSLLLILASCGWFLRLTLRPASAPVRVVLVAFILLDLGAFNWSEANKNVLLKSGDQYEQMLTLRSAALFVKAQPGLNRVRVSVHPEPNVGDIYGVQSLWGGVATLVTDFSKLSPHEDLLNVRYRIKPASTADPGAIYQDAQWKVYEDKNGFPRAWLAHQTILEPSHDAIFQRLDKTGVDLHNVAFIEQPLPRALDPAAAGDSIKFLSYEADRMSIDVNATGSGLLVLSEIFYPGWKATVNDEPAEIRKVDGALRGIVVPRGSDRIVLEYVPLSFYAGMTISLLTGAIVLLAFLWDRCFHPSANTEPSPSAPHS